VGSGRPGDGRWGDEGIASATWTKWGTRRAGIKGGVDDVGTDEAVDDTGKKRSHDPLMRDRWRVRGT
jgi:hypothetical protein